MPGGTNPVDSDSSETTNTTEPIHLLALGDSYISGEGELSYLSGTDTSNNKCHLSALSYPYLLGAKYATEYHSVACSGAVMGNIFSPNVDFPNQLVNRKSQTAYKQNEVDIIIDSHIVGTIEQHKFIVEDKPNVILLSIGGNDIGFSKIIKRCVLSFAGNPCYVRASERKGLLTMIYSKHDELVDTYRKILKESAPDTRLYVIGYPQVVNPTGNCGVNVHFDDQERQFAVQLIDRLNAALKNAAESAGVVFVDTSKALTGHRLCDFHDDGVNGLTDGDDNLSIGITLGGDRHTLGFGNESYHPTALGHRLLSQEIDEQTNHLTKDSLIATGRGQLTFHNDDPFITSASVHDSATVGRSVFEEIVDSFLVSIKQSLVVTVGAAPGSSYQIVMHSDEVELGSGVVPNDGKIQKAITVPNMEPGIHTIHIYTTNQNGEKVDINQDVYVVASDDDYDGDGIKNEDDVLPLINETGKTIVPRLAIDVTIITNPSVIQTAISSFPEQLNEAISQGASQEAETSQIIYRNLLASDDSPIASVVTSDTNRMSQLETTPKHSYYRGLLLLLIVFFVLTVGFVTIKVHKRSKK